MDRVEQLKKNYNLQKHPEGGYFSEVYTAPFIYEGDREVGGSIYFMLDKEDISHFHKIDVDEIWYYHEGSSMRIYIIDEKGNLTYQDLGSNIDEGESFMVVIPKGMIFGAENKDKNTYSFVSCATMPQFRYDGFKLLTRDEIYSLVKTDEDIERLII